MTKKELRSADARKSRQDPNQQSKSGAAKPTYVSTDKPKKKMKEEMDINEAKDKKGKGSGTKDACYHKVKSRYSVWPSAYASGALVKCRKKGAKNWGNSTKNEEFLALPEFSQLQIDAMRKNGIEVEVVEDCWDGYEKKGMKTMFGKKYPNCVKKKKATKEEVEKVDEACWKTHEQRGMKKKGGKMVPNCVRKGTVGEGYGMGQVDQKVGAVTSIPKDEQEKAKARLLAKAKMKRELAQKIKEDRERIEENRLSDEALEKAAAATLKRHKEQGYKVASTDSMKDVQDRIKKKKEQQSEGVLDAALKTDKKIGELHKKVDNDVKRMKAGKKFQEERIPSQNGNVYMVTFSWRGKMMAMKIFFPETRRPSRQEVEAAMDKVYPGCKVRHFDDSYVNQGDGYLNVGKPDVYAEFDEGAAWTKKSGKNPSGGLNEKGRKSYERENPGSDLKAPSKKVGNPRRKSFCARMKGMKSKLTSKKTASDPDSRINKSLRAWNC